MKFFYLMAFLVNGIFFTLGTVKAGDYFVLKTDQVAVKAENSKSQYFLRNTDSFKTIVRVEGAPELLENGVKMVTLKVISNNGVSLSADTPNMKIPLNKFLKYFESSILLDSYFNPKELLDKKFDINYDLICEDTSLQVLAEDKYSLSPKAPTKVSEHLDRLMNIACLKKSKVGKRTANGCVAASSRLKRHRSCMRAFSYNRKCRKKTEDHCRLKMKKYYNEKGVWKNIEKKERAEKILLIADSHIYQIKREGFLNNCASLVHDHLVNAYLGPLRQGIKYKRLKSYKGFFLKKSKDINRKISSKVVEKVFSNAAMDVLDSLKDAGRIPADNFEQTKGNIVRGLYQQFLQKKYIKNKAGHNNFNYATFMQNYQSVMKKYIESLYVDELKNPLVIIKNNLREIVTDKDLKKAGIRDTNKVCVQRLLQLKQNDQLDISDAIFKNIKLKGQQSLGKYSSLSNRNNPHLVHHQLSPEILSCVIGQESRQAQFEPLAMNYTFCRAYNISAREHSSAIGLGQINFNTFNDLRAAGVLPLAIDNYSEQQEVITNIKKNHSLFEQMHSDPIVQIEAMYKILNYKIKIHASVEKGVTAYDQDQEHEYIKGFKKCMGCMQRAKTSSKKTRVTCLLRGY